MKFKTIGGKSYRLTVFKVVSRKRDGTPNECVRLGDAESTHVDGGEEFFTAFVPEKVLAKKAN